MYFRERCITFKKGRQENNWLIIPKSKFQVGRLFYNEQAVNVVDRMFETIKGEAKKRQYSP